MNEKELMKKLESIQKVLDSRFDYFGKVAANIAMFNEYKDCNYIAEALKAFFSFEEIAREANAQVYALRGEIAQRGLK